jgi:hypothetical protein
MEKDAEFMAKMAEANMMEIEMGKVAQNQWELHQRLLILVK